MAIPNENRYGGVGTTVKSADQVYEERKKEAQEEEEKYNPPVEMPVWDSLTEHVYKQFTINRDARRDSGIEASMIDDLYQVSGIFQDDELAEIEGAAIYMNITATKQRAAKAWIKDVILPATMNPWEIVTSQNEDIPDNIKKMIHEALLEDEERLKLKIEEEIAASENPEGQPQQGQQRSAGSAYVASKKLKKISKLRRDIEESIASEIHKVANHNVKKLNREISDQLNESKFEDTLDEFIENFTTFPTAFMKGPIVVNKQKLVWENGDPVAKDRPVFMDYTMNPLDAYPSPGASSVYDGAFVEHLRVTPGQLYEFTRLDDKKTGYRSGIIQNILLEKEPGNPFWVDTAIEQEKSRLEIRGTQNYANDGVYHGLHFWGSVSAKLLREWGMSESYLNGKEDWEQVEIEAIALEGEIIKCRINSDPLKRRPYYAASFHPRPGSIWGRSLPELIRDIQGFCNLTASAIADNMGLASGIQMYVLTDRLASDVDIEEPHKNQVWQFVSDKTGGGQKPMEWFTVPSNVKELMALYDTFEAKADDATGIPRYAYGNERTAGAGATASGLNMLLEGASKGIKQAVMNIGRNVIKPRVEFQTYLYLLSLKENNDPFKFTGDLQVVVKAVENITIKAAQQQLRKELLQVTSNPEDIRIMGYAGRGILLREIFKDIGITEEVIPDRLDLAEFEEIDRANEQKRIDAEAQKADKSVRATEIQIQGQERMHQGSLQMQDKKIEAEREKERGKQQLEMMKMDRQNEFDAMKMAFDDKKAKLQSSTQIGVAVAKATADVEKAKEQPKGEKNE